jgi:hypothetical protein
VENPRACYEPAHADARLLDRGSSKTKPRSCGNQPAHESLLNRRLSVLSPAVDVVQKHSAWAEPGRRRSIKTLDGEHESWLLKKSQRVREGVGRRGIFCLGWVHCQESASAMNHFRFLFTPLDTLRPPEPEAWAGEQGCERQERRRRRRAPWRGRALSLVRGPR